jgi:hypothetical protein
VVVSRCDGGHSVRLDRHNEVRACVATHCSVFAFAHFFHSCRVCGTTAFVGCNWSPCISFTQTLQTHTHTHTHTHTYTYTHTHTSRRAEQNARSIDVPWLVIDVGLSNVVESFVRDFARVTSTEHGQGGLLPTASTVSTDADMPCVSCPCAPSLRVIAQRLEHLAIELNVVFVLLDHHHIFVYFIQSSTCVCSVLEMLVQRPGLATHSRPHPCQRAHTLIAHTLHCHSRVGCAVKTARSSETN